MDFDVAKNTIIEYNGCCKTVKIPTTINGEKITTIGMRSFIYNSDIEEVIIPAQIKVIEDSAFYKCSKLKRVIFEDNSCIEHIGLWAFAECKELEVFSINSQSLELRDYVFAWTSKLKVLDLSNTGITTLPEYFLHDSAVNKVMLPPAGVTKIGRGAFAHSQVDEEIFNKLHLTEVPPDAFFETKIKTIPYEILKGLTSPIGFNAFYGTALDKLTLPSTDIYPEGCFSHTLVKEVTFTGPYDKNFIIPESMFESCSTLCKVTFPDNLVNIEAKAFMCCNLRSVNFPPSTKTIGDYAFFQNILDSLDLSETNIDYIGYATFGNNDIEKLYLNPFYCEINDYAFGQNPIKECSNEFLFYEVNKNAFVSLE